MTILAGMGAVLGNVVNPYRGFRGGQGLGIAAGVLVAAAPFLAVGLAAVIAPKQIRKLTGSDRPPRPARA